MNFIIHCLLISCILVLTNGEDYFIPSILALRVVESLKNGESNLTGSNEHKLTLVEEGELGRSPSSLVWEGIYNDKENVAIKICMDNTSMHKEMIVYEALNAVNNEKIEDYHIPRIYYGGVFLGKHFAIAMSLFDGTLADYYTKRNNKHLSDADILSILLQAVKGLEYLSTKKVVHNDIKPHNLFYRGKDVFIGDFDLATVNRKQNRATTILFASRSFFANQSRFAKDDLESLVYSLWFLAEVPMARAPIPMDEVINEETLFPPLLYRPEGETFFENLKKGKNYARLQLEIKLKHFTNKYVREVFEEIIDEEFFSIEPIPNYQGIIQTLADAIKRFDKNQGRSEWLLDGLCSIVTLCEK